jgi:hypothetical protein
MKKTVKINLIWSPDQNRYTVYSFDSDTYVVIDQEISKEICVCSNYDDVGDAENRALYICGLLNQNSSPPS